ncbi:peptide deformylase [Candidatus Roizmanbacteria bacterium]|nr:peptide deformylase [Candidatus Roizmanbacteria bacterium]
MLKIVTVPNPILTAPTQPVKNINEPVRQLIKQMAVTLNAQVDPQGVGLAAPQIGQSLALFIMKPSPDAAPRAFINPKIRRLIFSKAKKPVSSAKKTRRHKLEGCLSIPKIWSPIGRAIKVSLEYQDLAGKINTKWFTSFEAVIIQHEVDHLEGILFTKRAIEQSLPVYEEQGKKLTKVEI